MSDQIASIEHESTGGIEGASRGVRSKALEASTAASRPAG